MRGMAVLVLAIATVWPAAANARSPEQLFREFGLFGTWAGDCQAAASPTNPHVIVRMPRPGVISEEQHLGLDNAINRYRVLGATRLSATALSVQVLFNSGAEDRTRETLVFAIHGRTRRTMFNQVESGPVRVQDGIALWNGSKTPLLRKCE